MKAVVLGDIGWRTLYHLGDEAMTEVAIEMLRQHGVDEIVVLAGQPEIAEKFYGVPAVKRVGYLGKWGRRRDEVQLAQVDELLASPAALQEAGVYEAVRTADLAVIAGGGNMNSDHFHHLYERLSFARIARRFEVPLFVTSQTIGPMLRPVDRQMVAEIIDYSTCFGTRERTSYGLAKELTHDTSKIVHTYDDASLLQPDEDAFARVDELQPRDRPYAVASFTAHQGTTGLTSDGYEAKVAALLDNIVTRFDVDVVLAPHAGSLDTSTTTHDQNSNARISAISRTGRVRALPMLSAREVVALTQNSVLSISSRYHPAVFAPQVATPALAISLSYYSSVRMRGALANVGLQRFVVPYTEWDAALSAIDEIMADNGSLADHLAPIAETTRKYQDQWWTAIVAAAKNGEWRSPGNHPEAPEYVPENPWSERVEIVTPVFDLLGKEKVYSKWFSQDRDAASKRSTELRARLDDLNSSISDKAEAILRLVK